MNGYLKAVVKPAVEAADGSSVTPTVGFDIGSSLTKRFEDANQNGAGQFLFTRWYTPTLITSVGDPENPTSRNTTEFNHAKSSPNRSTFGSVLQPSVIRAIVFEGKVVRTEKLSEEKPVLSSITTPDGTARFSLNTTKGEISQTHRETTVTDTRGYTTRYSFNGEVIRWNNELGRAIALTDMTRSTGTTPGPEPEQTLDVTYTYSGDVHGNLVAVNDVSGNTVRYEYDSRDANDAYNRPDADGNPRAFGTGYQIHGKPSRSVLSAGDLNLRTEYRYDTGFNKLKREIDALGVETRYRFDGRGNRTAVTEALGTGVEATTAYAYDASGFVTRTEDPDGRLTTYTPNAWGHLDTTTVRGFAGEDLTPLSGGSHLVTRRLTDDPSTPVDEGVLDLTYATLDPTGDRTAFTYDAWNRQTSSTLPPVPGSGVGPSTRTRHDARGNVALTTDERGTSTATFYDLMNRPVAVVLDFDGDGVFGNLDPGQAVRPDFAFEADPQDIAHLTSYDRVGNVATTTDPRGNVTGHAYDAMLRKVRTDLPEVTGLNGGLKSYSLFWEFGENSGSGAFTLGGFNPTRSTDARGFSTIVRYDTAYRATETIQQGIQGYPDNGFVLAEDRVTQTTYDAVHNVVQAKRLAENSQNPGAKNHTTTTFYDARRRPTVVSTDLDGRGPDGGFGFFVGFFAEVSG